MSVRGLHKIIYPFAPDQSGAVSVLYELGGMIIPKEKYTQIDIDVKTKEDTYHYVIEVKDSGEATIRVRSLNRDPISFDGTMLIK